MRTRESSSEGAGVRADLAALRLILADTAALAAAADLPGACPADLTAAVESLLARFAAHFSRAGNATRALLGHAPARNQATDPTRAERILAGHERQEARFAALIRLWDALDHPLAARHVLRAFIEEMNHQLCDEEQWIVDAFARPPTRRFSLATLWRRWKPRKTSVDGREHQLDVGAAGRRSRSLRTPPGA